MKKKIGMLHSGSQLICESKSPLYVDCLKSRYKMRNETNLPKKKQNKTKQKKKTASSPCQDLHPDWDRFRGTMLYPLSCGELAMNGEQILRLYVASGLCTARNKWAKILRNKCFDSKITSLQKLLCLI